MLDPERGAMAFLDASATALLAAGYADPFTSQPALRLRCLLAGERVQRLGARPDQADASARSDELAGAVVLALVALSVLTVDRLVDTEVGQTQFALRAVLAELG